MLNISSWVLQIIFLLLVLCSISVIFARNLIFSLLSLAFSFLMGAICFLILDAELIGLLTIIIYMGAIIILFLFAIMMLEYKIIDITQNDMSYVFMIYLMFAVGFGFIIVVSFNNCFNPVDYYENIKSPELELPKLIFEILEDSPRGMHFSETYTVLDSWVSVKQIFSVLALDIEAVNFFESTVFTLKWLKLIDSLTDAESYAQIIYSRTVLSFFLTGIALLLATLSVVYLGKRFENKIPEVFGKTMLVYSRQIARHHRLVSNSKL